MRFLEVKPAFALTTFYFCKKGFINKIMKIIDLTHSIAEGMPMYPGADAPKLQIAYSHNEHGFMETQISMLSHTGTHIDAPLHIIKDGHTLTQYPIEQFIGKAVVIDCRKLKNGDQITMSLIKEKGFELNKAEFILFLTGQSALWGKPDYFSSYPIMTQEVAELVNQRKLKGIGIDAPSFDPCTIDNIEQAADELHNHKEILKTGNTVFIENLCNLEKIGSELFTLFALPLKTVNADGAPARVVAILN